MYLVVSFLFLLASPYQDAGKACCSLTCISKGVYNVGDFTCFMKMICKSTKIFKTRKTEVFVFHVTRWVIDSLTCRIYIQKVNTTSICLFTSKSLSAKSWKLILLCFMNVQKIPVRKSILFISPWQEKLQPHSFPCAFVTIVKWTSLRNFMSPELCGEMFKKYSEVLVHKPPRAQ